MAAAGKSFVLLLTATIDPGATPMVARSDPRTRLKDYEQALSAWLECGAVRQIVLYENSGYDIGSLREIARRFPRHEVEFHSFEGNREAAARGKGYAELVGIARTLAESKLIKDDQLIVKCTGRLIVRNAVRLLTAIERERFDVMCTLHSYLSYAESRLFVATPAFISDYLLGQQEVIDDLHDVVFENALAYATARALADRKSWRPFPLLPVMEGVSGTTGGLLTNRPGKRLLRALSHRIRRFVYKN
jgi:hypothetical protein